ncbi:MAG TPA: uracil-DNA glycosylase family protein [Burkholderiaceae bacterium]|nr:uracil-DNA glycosylase family protein [Burkholderiaceae bacterium]
MQLVEIARRLRREVDRLTFGAPVAYVYNPLDYAWAPYCEYLARYGAGHPPVLLLGLNPGPFGMAQTGVPFGDVTMVRGWLGIERPVGRPAREHPKRPVLGFACHRREISGERFWGWARDTYGTPAHFFARFFVTNYCPLVFLEESGRNRTPEKLPGTERAPLFAACDRALRATAEHLRPRCVVGIGHVAAACAARALQNTGVRLGSVPHPSPASPAANRDWAAQMTRALDAFGVGVRALHASLPASH